MPFNQNIFKKYDIRGIYGRDFDENFAYELGLAYGWWRAREVNKKEIKIAVAADMRLSSPVLKEKLLAGLLDAGAQVMDIGLAATPTLYFAVAHCNADGGIMVSASHNPKEYNGFKLVRERAYPISQTNGLLNLKELIGARRAKKSNTRGTVEMKKNILAEQLERDLKFVQPEKIKKFKIVIDPANSLGALYFDELFKNIKAELIKMNWELDGSFPNHEADPLKPENVKDLGERVKKEKADLGIATDGDGDRIFFTDEKGEIVEPGITRALLSKIFLREKPGAKIAYDIRPGRITRDVILENNGRPIITPVGHSLIKEQSIKEGVFFAGESSGHFFLKMAEGFFEAPVIVTLKILEELSRAEIPFSRYLEPYRKYFHSGEINLQADNPQTKINLIKEKYGDGRQNELDGISVEYPDFWFNVRSSNTEPLLRLNLEATSKKIMENKRDEILKIIGE